MRPDLHQPSLRRGPSTLTERQEERGEPAVFTMAKVPSRAQGWKVTSGWVQGPAYITHRACLVTMRSEDGLHQLHRPQSKVQGASFTAVLHVVPDSHLLGAP